MSDTFVAFGKGLQLTNVLRDISRDLRIGRCYLPRTEFGCDGTVARGLAGPGQRGSGAALLVAWLRTAWNTTHRRNSTCSPSPARCLRVRMAVLWPIIIGLATLARLARNERWLDPDRSSRVSRGWVYRTLILSWPSVHSNLILGAWISRLRRQVEAAL